MKHDPRDPFPRVTVPPEVAESLLRFATLAADHEALKDGPPSRIPGPDGRPQGETPHEAVKRIVTAAVLHLIEIGLLVVPDDLADRLDDFLPISRDNDQDWSAPLPLS